MVGIISNSAALFAQRNLESASAQSRSSIARLSSGNRIIKASDDVAGLAIGTTLATTVSSLRTVLSSTAQAGSLLSIADGGLQNVSDILQRQKSLAVQANTGSLSSNERAFLDQEFQNLVLEIDRLVTNTNFNGVSLIDGSINSSSGLVTAIPTAATALTTSGTGTTSVLTTAGFVGNAFAAGTVTEANDDVIGTLTDAVIDVTGTSMTATTSRFNITINGVAFQSETFTSGAANTTFLFTEVGSGTLAFDLNMSAAVVTDQTEADATAVLLEADLTGLTIRQDRGFAESGTGSVTTAAFDGTVLAGAGGADFIVRSASFNTTSANTAPLIGAFTVTAETATTNGQISVTVDGNTYSTLITEFDTNTGTNIDTANGGDSTSAGVIYLYLDSDKVTNPNDRITIDLNAAALDSTGIDMNTATSATSLQTALNTGFGSGSSGGLTFQVGTTSTDSIDLSLSSAATSAIYKDDAGTVQTLAVTTAAGAITASDVLDNAINTITSLRSTVGGLQSRFNFAAANIQSSIQNTEAARSNFLDVDVAAESTNFATAQVRLQASISVLAQANQLPQNLLKLIG